MKYYVDPKNVTNFNRSEPELELFFMFCAVVAGKNAHTQALALERFILSLPEAESPFDRIALIGRYSQGFLDKLKESRLGQYAKLAKCFQEAYSFLRYGLSNCSLEELESIHGIGPKTARFFLIHTRPNQKLAALDTHILHYLRDQGYEAPTGTPGPKLYKDLEQTFIYLAEKSGQTLADFDLTIWKKYSGNS